MLLTIFILYFIISVIVCVVSSYTRYKIGVTMTSSAVIVLYSALWPLVCVMVLVYYMCELKKQKVK